MSQDMQVGLSTPDRYIGVYAHDNGAGQGSTLLLFEGSCLPARPA